MWRRRGQKGLLPAHSNGVSAAPSAYHSIRAPHSATNISLNSFENQLVHLLLAPKAIWPNAPRGQRSKLSCRWALGRTKRRTRAHFVSTKPLPLCQCKTQKHLRTHFSSCCRHFFTSTIATLFKIEYLRNCYLTKKSVYT